MCFISDCVTFNQCLTLNLVLMKSLVTSILGCFVLFLCMSAISPPDVQAQNLGDVITYNPVDLSIPVTSQMDVIKTVDVTRLNNNYVIYTLDNIEVDVYSYKYNSNDNFKQRVDFTAVAILTLDNYNLEVDNIWELHEDSYLLKDYSATIEPYRLSLPDKVPRILGW